MTIYDTITASIVAGIEHGAGEFRMPWHRASTDGGIPHNALTGTDYRGSNVLMLWAAAMGKGYESTRWATYKQWAAMGAQVRKSEKATTGIYYSVTAREDAETGETKTARLGRAFFLFNAAQVDGYSTPDAAPRVDLTDRVRRADDAIAATGAKITHSGSRAFYRPSTDCIHLPPRDAFIGTETSTATEAYYSTALHELAHWTGHTSRLSRDFTRSKRFGDEAYAGEELVAELGAAFLCAQLGITNSPRADHAQYLAHWLKVLKTDSRAIVRAASDAQKAADYICNAQKADAAPLAVAA